MKTRQYLLLPGPTDVPQPVLAAMNAPMINHRGPEFKEILTDITEKVKTVFKTKNDVYILTTSGTGGLEAAVSNFIDPGDKVIVASIGNFGERFYDIAAAYGAEVDFIDFGWGNAIDPKVIADKLAADKNREIKAVLFQQNETSTAVLNPVREIAAARGGHPALFIVDAVSGLCAANLETDAWGLDVVVAGSQKAFMSPPGLAFLAVSERAMEKAKICKNTRYYFSLLEAKKWYDKGQTPFTPAIPVFYAVQKALTLIAEAGVDRIIAEHFFHRDLVRAGLRALGLRLLAADEIASPAVTAVACPQGIDPAVLRKKLLDTYNIVVAVGQGKFAENSFRVGHLGAVQPLDLIVAIAGLEMVLKELGVPVTLGSGVKAIEEALLKK